MPISGTVFDLSSLNGTNGFQINGEAARDYSGYSVASAGDVNGDGFDDLIIGARGADPNGNSSGASYVVFGKASGFNAELALSALNGSKGFQINGEAEYDYSGRSVASAGDVNGDGFDDLIIGVRSADPNSDSSGASYVVFGKAGGFAAELELSTLNGSNGFQINGAALYDYSGHSAASAGDVNGDGFDDLIIGAFGADPNGIYSGASYVVFGKAGGFAAEIELSALNGSNGFQINGEAVYDSIGHSVASAGDVNGDGFDDLIIGAFGADPNGSGSGASYVVFGKASGFAARLELSALNGNNGFQINGEAGEDQSGFSAASAGDVNGDGYDDLIIGAFGADPNGDYSGASYVVFGKASGFAAEIELSALNGNNGFQINGEAGEDRSGYSVASAGDVNGDGFDDLIIGAHFADPNGDRSGASYVVFGKASGFAAVIELSALNGNNGFQINGEAGEDISGYSVASAGDVNGDGFDDLIIGAHGADPNGNASGASYVVFGKATFTGNEVLTGTSAADTLFGHDGDDTLFALDGDDLVYGGFGNDLVYGDSGNDLLEGGAGNDTLEGGAGNDRLEGDDGSNTLAGGADNDTYVTDGGDTITESSGAGTDLVESSVSLTLGFNLENLKLTGTASISGTGNDLGNQITGNAGNNLLNGTTGADTLVGGLGDDTYVTDGGDVLTEGLNAGTDLVQSSISWTLGFNLENLTLTGTANIQGTGDSLANRITGNAGNNLLNGTTGNDTLVGGLGNDTYVTNGGDVLTEGLNAGTDLVQSSVNLTLGSNLEKLILTGTANLSGTGNGLGNRITGNAGDNRLNGGLGSDTLTGGAGSDTFVFSAALGVANIDRITDFNAVDDTIRLDDAIFLGLSGGSLAATAFEANTTGQAMTASGRIIYETDTGRLYFDQDGAGGAAHVRVATLTAGLALTNADFFVF